MLNEKIAVTVKDFQGKLDKNGESPVYLNVLAGKCPNRNVLSGTIAKQEGFELGESYLVQVRELEANKYGRQFSFSKITKLDAVQVLDIEDRLGEGVILDVSTDENIDRSTGQVMSEAKAEEYDEAK